MSDVFLRFIKGIVLGLVFFVPGVSGAIIAIMLNIYDKIIISLGNLLKDFKKNASYLLPIGLGTIIGLLISISILSRILNDFEMFLMFFLMGSLIGSVPLMIQKTEIRKFNFKHILFVLLGMMLILILRFIPSSSDTDYLPTGMIIIAGLFIAVSIILPGLCTLPILATLGILGVLTDAVNEMNILFLWPLGISIAIWIILSIKILEKGLVKYPTHTYLMIAGFMIGSIFQVFPEESPQGIEILLSIILVSLGMFIPILFSRLYKSQNQIKESK